MVVGLVETHGRRETEALLEGMEVMPRRRVGASGGDVGTNSTWMPRWRGRRACCWWTSWPIPTPRAPVMNVAGRTSGNCWMPDSGGVHHPERAACGIAGRDGGRSRGWKSGRRCRTRCSTRPRSSWWIFRRPICGGGSTRGGSTWNPGGGGFGEFLPGSEPDRLAGDGVAAGRRSRGPRHPAVPSGFDRRGPVEVRTGCWWRWGPVRIRRS